MAVRKGTQHRHGTTYGYNAQGCRCLACCTARSDYMRAWRAKVREKKEALEGNSKLEVMKLEIVPVANPPWDGTEPCTTAPDKNIFHGQNHPEIREAKTYCEVCPIKQECLDYAMAVMEDGVYGGTTFGEREKIRRRRM